MALLTGWILAVGYARAQPSSPAPTDSDSLDAAQNRIVWHRWLTGSYVHVRRSAERFWQVGPLLPNLLQYNTVEGWVLGQSFDFNQAIKHQQFVNTGAALRYGLGGRRFYGKFHTAYTFDRRRHFTLRLEAGRWIQQFNDQNPIGLANNTFTSLVAGRNFMKLYERNFGELRLQRDFWRGLTPSVSIGYEGRNALQNTTLYSFRALSKRRYTSNNPQAPLNDAPAFESHRALWYETQLKLHPELLLGLEALPDMGGRWPVVWLSYRRGVPNQWQSSLNYHRISLRLSQRFVTGPNKQGELRYELASAKFLSTNRLYFMDFNHFAGNQSGFSSNRIDAFAMLNYYSYSNASWYLRAHVEQRMGGQWLGKIPALGRLAWQEVLGGRLLYTPELRLYAEANIGIENILRVYRLDFVFNYTQGQLGAAWRLGVAL